MSENGYEKKLARAVINRALKDVTASAPGGEEMAFEYFESGRFKKHCKSAGYPEGLPEALNDLRELSPLQKRVTVGEVLETLKEY